MGDEKRARRSRHATKHCILVFIAIWSLILFCYLYFQQETTYSNPRSFPAVKWRVPTSRVSVPSPSERPTVKPATATTRASPSSEQPSVKHEPTSFQRKSFVYMTQTESCLQLNLAVPLGNSSSCNCDVIVLSFKTPCKEEFAPHITHFFKPKTIWTSGRNALFFAARERRAGYLYYIIQDEDAYPAFNGFTPPAMRATGLPFRAFEKWLLEYEPAIGVCDYAVHNGANVYYKRRRELCGINETSPVIPVVYFDPLFNAFHCKAVNHILPYRVKYDYDSWYHTNNHIISSIEIKFPGQALMFTYATTRNPTHRSYPQDGKLNNLEVWREWLKDLRQQTPSEYRNNSMFENFLADPVQYVKTSDTICMNATKRQPIVPYSHFRRN